MRRAAGIDLPLKALVREDADGKVWLTRNNASGSLGGTDWTPAAPRPWRRWVRP